MDSQQDSAGKRLHVKVQAREHTRYEKLAQDYGLNLSELVRLSLNYVAENQPVLAVYPPRTEREAKIPQGA